MALRDDLIHKIKVLNDTIWDDRATEPQINSWLGNFEDGVNGTPEERELHALYLLSQFMYFGNRQMRELMRVVFRDLYKYPIIEEIRASRGHTTDRSLIDALFNDELDKTLFLGVGNPSESGYHLLYYFRQENGLPKTCFVHSHEVFRRRRLTTWQVVKALIKQAFALRIRDPFLGTQLLRRPEITRYVFLDDFCGSGHQGEQYSQDIVQDIKSMNPHVSVSYIVLFATSNGMEYLRTHTDFDSVQCVFELDETFRCFSTTSRYFPCPSSEVTAAFAEQLCRDYGDQLLPGDPLGYGDCQLLLGFHHNTPDNTLPIFWSDEAGTINWRPIFKRYPKIYG